MGTTTFSSLLGKEQLIHELKDFYIPYRDSLELPLDATFGLEIEFKMPGYDWKYRSDFSEAYTAAEIFMKEHNYIDTWDVCNEKNDHIEIVSPVLTDNAKAWNDLHNVLKYLKENGAYYSGECGAHIHVGMHLLGKDEESWINFFKIWSIFEDVIFKFTNGETYNSRLNFQKSSKSVRTRFNNLISNYIISNGRRKTIILNKKYCVNINQASLDLMIKHGNKFKSGVENTIEFRSPNGTLNEVIWQNNVNFFTKLLLACKNKNYDTELVEYFYGKVIKKDKLEDDNLAFILADLIFNNDFDKLCFLRQYYKDFDIPSKEDPLIKSKPFWK